MSSETMKGKRNQTANMERFQNRLTKEPKAIIETRYCLNDSLLERERMHAKITQKEIQKKKKKKRNKQTRTLRVRFWSY